MTPNSGSNLSVIGTAADDDTQARPPGTALTGDVVDQRGPDDPHDEDETIYLTANDILGMDDVVTEIVLVPEWTKNGKVGKVMLQSINADQRDRYLNSIQYTDAKGRQRYDLKGSNARLVCMAAINPNTGQPLFKLSQWEALQDKNAAVLERLAAKARKMGGLSNLEEEEEERNRREGLG